MMYACRQGNVEMYELLYTTFGADTPVEEVDDFRRSCLSYAAARGHMNMLQTALQDCKDCGLYSQTLAAALVEAYEFGHTEAVALLSKSLDGYDTINRTGSITLMVACEYGRVSAVRSLLAMGADMHYTDAEGDNALTVACRGKHD